MRDFSSFSLPLVLVAVTATVLVTLLSGCTATCAKKCAGKENCISAHVRDFVLQEKLQVEGIPWPVYATPASGPPVLMLHDIGGARPECLDLALKISREKGGGYQVFIPVLFGKFGQGSRSRALTAAFGMGPEWFVQANDQDQPIFKKLLGLCHQIRKHSEGRKVVVIGNCFTASVAAALLSSEDVCAAVISQPALPYPRLVLFHTPAGKRALGMSPETLAAAARRAQKLPAPALIGFRSKKDAVSPQARFDRLKCLFGNAFEGHVLCEKPQVCRGHFNEMKTDDETRHSVLIPPAVNPAPGEVYQPVYETLRAFLRDHHG